VNFTLEQVMTEFPHTIDADETADTAHAMLIRYGVRHLPVEQAGEIVGVLSERDVNLALSPSGEGAGAIAVLALCSRPAYMVDKREPLAPVLRRMAERRYGCVLVSDRGQLVGIATAPDLFRWMAAWLERDIEQRRYA
jgi:acetoin utilization protein AcuB